VVVGSALARVWFVADGAPPLRATGATAALLVPLAIGLWFEAGPAQHGWAKRAGTPATLLARRSQTVLTAVRTPPKVALPTTSFSSTMRGRITETNDASGLVNVELAGTLTGRPGGAVRIDLRGEPLGGGVTMTASGVSYVPRGTRTVYTGSVTTLAGQEVVALVSVGADHRLRLDFRLSIAARSGTVSGTVAGTPVPSQ